MNQNKNRINANIILTIIFLIICTFNLSYAKEISLNFNPPDNTTFIETMKSVKEIKPEMGDSRTEKNISKTEYVIQKTNSGYTVKKTILSIELTRNGMDINDPTIKLLENLEITYLLDESGRIQEIKGLDQLIDKIKDYMPPQIAQFMLKSYNEESMKQKELIEWKGRFQKYIGKKVKLNDESYIFNTMSIAGLEGVPYFTIEEYKAFNIEDEEKLKLNFWYANTLEKLAELTGKTVDELNGQFEEYLNALPDYDVDVHGTGERIVDPNTLLIISEQMDRIYGMKKDLPGHEEPVYVITDEHREYDYEYIQ